MTEVVCGVRFEPSPNFTLPHIGLLWNKFREEYPRVEHAPPLAPGPNQILIDSATGAPLPRVWFKNMQDNQLIQFQTDRIYFNWRQRQDTYPQYENVINNFEGVLDTIEAFFKESELGKFIPIEYELSFINHISKGEGQDTVEGYQRVFRDLQWRCPHDFLPNPANISWNMRFALPDKKGYLYTSFNEGTLKDNKPIFILTLTARGDGQDHDRKGIREWFDTAHVWIVCGFADLTTEKIQEEWGKENA